MNSTDERLKPRHLGYGLYWMWTMLCFQSTLSFLLPGIPQGTLLAARSTFFLVSIVTTVLAHPVWVLLIARLPSICSHAPWAASTAASLSILSLGFSFMDTSWAQFALGAVNGIASALIDMHWLQILGSLPTKKSSEAACLSICMAVVGYMAFSLPSSIVPVVSTFALTVLPLASAAMTDACQRAGEGTLDAIQVMNSRRYARRTTCELLWPVCGSLAFFFVLGCIQSIATTRIDYNAVHASSLICEATAVAILYVMLHRRSHLNTNRLYATVMALVCSGFLALPFAINQTTDGMLFACAILVNVGAMIIDVAIICGIARSVYAMKTSGALVGGMARGVTVGAIVLGKVAGSHVAERLASGTIDIALFVVVVTYLLILCCALFMAHMREQDVSRCAKGDAHENHGENATTSLNPEEKHIEAVARRHRLSRRETDVFALIARGRSIPYTAEALTISENTVRSHVRRIYDKLGVHSKQELLDLVETEREPAVR